MRELDLWSVLVGVGLSAFGLLVSYRFALALDTSRREASAEAERVELLGNIPPRVDDDGDETSSVSARRLIEVTGWSTSRVWMRMRELEEQERVIRDQPRGQTEGWWRRLVR